MSATSSNASLVPNANLIFGGSGAYRTLKLKPLPDQFGTTTIVLMVSDGIVTTRRTFVFKVNPVNDVPTISKISAKTIAKGTRTEPIPFTIGDAEADANNLIVTATSSNRRLVPKANIVLGGSGANRTITIIPVAGKTGTTTITLYVSDGQKTIKMSFVVLVTASATITTPLL